MSTPIYAHGKVVGHVEAGAFVKRVRASVHMLRRPMAWALDVQSLKDAQDAGARFVEIRDQDTGCTYRASIVRILEKGFVFERGHGRQIGLALQHWHVERPGVRQLALGFEGL